MTQEDKELLLKDLGARLLYKVKVCLYEKETCILMGIDGHEVYLDVDSDSFRIESIKPYLRPMSSMTEEEAEEFRLDFHYDFYIGYSYSLNNKDGSYMMPVSVMRDYFDWLNAHHFDYRGLIDKGLALEAPKNMYKL